MSLTKDIRDAVERELNYDPLVNDSDPGGEITRIGRRPFTLAGPRLADEDGGAGRAAVQD
jgi:hypothetical protein